LDKKNRRISKARVAMVTKKKSMQTAAVQHFIFYYYFLNFYFIHMCIQCLSLFSLIPPASSLSPTPTLSPQPPRYLAETILPLSLILLKREYKQ
jgi:hypothetical protein